MIAVNYPSSVLELLLREFLVFMYEASQKNSRLSQFTKKIILKLGLHLDWAEAIILPLWNLGFVK